MNIRDLLDKVRDLDFETFFPLYRKPSDVQNLLINTGIYLGIMIFAVLLIVLLGHIFILGVILWIVGVIAVLYSLVGMFAELLRFMKYN